MFRSNSPILSDNEIILYSSSLHWVGFLSFRSFLSLFVLAYIDSIAAQITVTNKRIIYREGILQRKVSSFNFNGIEVIELEQGLCGLMLGYGNIILITNSGERKKFYAVAKPIDFRKACPF